MLKLTPDNLILALDMDSSEEAIQWVKRLKGRIGCFKVGLQLYTQAGRELIQSIRSMGANVFLDLKFHDIPNTVAKAVQSVSDLDVKFLTIHTLGGKEMMKAALEAAPSTTTVLGVTVLTSMSDIELSGVGIARNASAQVEVLAGLAKEAGLKGLVCSPLEVTLLRKKFANHFTLVTPGVRPAGAAMDDQSRVMTPGAAIQSGSNHVVIGRPILRAESPEKLIDQILAGEA